MSGLRKLFGNSRRLLCTDAAQDVREAMRLLAKSGDGIVRASPQSPPPPLEKNLFVNTELDLDQIKAYGFDYDYTLVQYNQDVLNRFIYRAALNNLIEEKRYPVELLKLEYDPLFATRGLHFDVRHGTFIKLDSNYGIQANAVVRGRELLSLADTQELYEDRHLSRNQQAYLRAIPDAFALPEACLLADVVQFFTDKKIVFNAPYLAEDVQASISSVHISGQMYNQITSHPDKYILPVGEEVRELLTKLKNGGKQLFIITNSPYWFMDAGMTHLLGPNWTQFFEVIITSAGKPGFFTGNRDFRLISSNTGRLKWGEVGPLLVPGRAYAQGSMAGLMSRVQWQGHEVLYCGDHVQSDIIEPVREHGWQTACITSEIEDEVRIRMQPEQQLLRNELREVEALMRGVSDPSASTRKAMKVLKQHRRNLQYDLKSVHNQYFGSIFRTHKRPTLYMEQMQRYSNVYTSKLTNLLHYPLDAILYPPRQRLPHEKSKTLKYSGEFLAEL